MWSPTAVLAEWGRIVGLLIIRIPYRKLASMPGIVFSILFQAQPTQIPGLPLAAPPHIIYFSRIHAAHCSPANAHNYVPWPSLLLEYAYPAPEMASGAHARIPLLPLDLNQFRRF